MKTAEGLKNALAALTLAAVAAGCAGGGSKASPGIGADTMPDGAAAVRELPLPVIPGDVTAPEKRADYVASHFWDTLDFETSREALDTAFIEQNFANYLLFLGYATDDGRREAVAGLLDRAAENIDAMRILLWAADHYLHDPNSPMRSEDLYITFLEATSRHPSLTPEERGRDAWRLANAKKNRPGSRAADIAMTLRDGRRTTLLGELGDGYTLLIFYDPGCEHCGEIIGELRGMRELAELAGRGEMRVIAVDGEDDRGLWERTAAGMPEGWIVGFDESDIRERETYVYSATPTIYLLDSAGTVVAKDILPGELAAMLRR